jgi:NAD(P)-dependent dehydrogenase (short-subunit alcohol dehydrogenase family)
MSAQLRTYAAEDAMLRAIPLRRMGTPEDIGGTVLFLCGRAGAWTTGTIVTVDGGTTAKPFTMADGMH